MRQTLKSHSYFILFFGALFFLFFWPLLALKAVFIRGDNAVQFYPWAYQYAQAVKAGGLPYWTTLMGNGFPLVAEGQTAPYYLFNLFSYLLLPFRFVYAWSVPLHSLLGGVGFYFYSQSIGLKKESAAFAAALFSFSSAYGGCFYTIGTLQVLSWLPWCLWLLERMARETRGKKLVFHATLMSLLFSQMWTAGFPQAALYAYLYLALLALFHEKRRAALWLGLAAAGLAGILLALPQILSTLELAKASVRQGESLGFALWGSVPPPALIALLFPHWGIFLRVSFYLGILPLFFILSVIFIPKTRIVRLHLWLALFFFSLALGKYNPFYAFFVDSLSLTFLRNPAKFLFFSAASLSVAAGYGLDTFLSRDFKTKTSRRIKRALSVALFLALLLPLAAQTAYRMAEKPLGKYGNHYAESVFQGKTEPLHSVSDYRLRVSQMLEQLGGLLSPGNVWNLAVAFFAVFSFFLLRRWMSGRLKRRTFLAVVWVLVSLDLYLFGHFFGYGFVGNAGTDTLTPETQSVIEKVRQWQDEKGGLVIERAEPGAELLEPNSSMRHSIAHAGAYSPLLLKRYYELTKDLGIVDSSLGRPPFSREVWTQQRKLLDLLGVNLVLADRQLDLPGLELSQTVGDRRFYRNPGALPLLFVVYDWKTITAKEARLNYLKSASFEPSKEAVLEEEPPIAPNASVDETASMVVTEKDAMNVRARVTLQADSLLIFRNCFYPRWKAEADGVPAKLFVVDHAFSGIFAEKGTHEVRFYYDRGPQRKAEVFSLVFFLFLGVLNLAFWKKMSAKEWSVIVWIWGTLLLYILVVVLPKLGG